MGEPVAMGFMLFDVFEHRLHLGADARVDLGVGQQVEAGFAGGVVAWQKTLLADVAGFAGAEGCGLCAEEDFGHALAADFVGAFAAQADFRGGDVDETGGTFVWL